MRFQLPLALLAILPTAACVDSEPETAGPSADEIASALEQDNGGFETTDEAPAFAAEELYRAAGIEADTAFADPMASDAEMVALENAVGAERHHVLILWGQLPADPTQSPARDWSGELRLSRGGMLVRRRIAFEDTMDRVLPRTSRDVVHFESYTRPHADGLALTVVDPTPAATDALTLTYTPRDGGAAHVVNLANLANGPLVVDLPDGNRFIVTARRRLAGAECEHGFMRGRWHQLAPNLGSYLGVVANADGEAVGHVRGIYGQRGNGERVLFGKFINREGQFTGILKGTYEGGKFAARWLTRDGDHGQLHGVYFPGPTLRAGAFLARWGEASCAN